jgi:hypothetical protein
VSGRSFAHERERLGRIRLRVGYFDARRARRNANETLAM